MLLLVYGRVCCMCHLMCEHPLIVKSVWPSLRVCVVVVAIYYKTEHNYRYMYIALGAIYRLACSIGCFVNFDF